MKQIISSIFLVHLICVFAHAQDASKSLERELWRTRADILTSNLLKDASKKDALARALLKAQLSDLWWEFERNQANTWIEKSVDAIAFYPAEEAKEQKERFFRVVRQVLALISTHNKKQSTRLVEILSKSEQDLPDKEKKSNAEALIEQAIKIVKTDPQSATNLGLRALSLGFPANTYKLAWDLRHYNSHLANQFFRAALSRVSAAPDTAKLYGMQRIAFPEANNPDFPVRLIPPRELRILFLDFVADHLYQRQLRFTSKAIQSCLDDAVFTTRLRDSFTELLPQKSDMVEQAINICLSNQKQEAKQLLNPNDTQTTNIDDLLNQADRIQGDPFLRGRYLLNAAFASHQQKKFAISIEILEKMSNEERKVDTNFWDELRLDSGASLAVAEFKEGEVARANKTLKDLPDALQPLGQITFVFQFSPEDITCYQFCVDLLNDARRGIVKSELPFARRSSYWLNLVKLYSSYKLHTEAAAAFREVVTAFNSSKSVDTASNDAASNRLIDDSKRIVPAFSPMLFEMKEDSMFESVRLLNDERPRTQINLEFLKMMLQKYRSLKLELEKKVENTN